MAKASKTDKNSQGEAKVKPRRLTESLVCIVLRVRENGTSTQERTARAGGRPIEGRSDGAERRQQMGPGTARAHLENCTGKKLISAKKSERNSRKIPVRSEGLEDRTQIKSLHRISIVLGV